MKDIIALIFLISVVVATFRFAITKQFNAAMATIFLGAGLFGGLIIANYDLIQSLKWKDIEIETFRGDVQVIKDKAISDIRSEIANQKSSINLLISTANELSTKIAQQKSATEVILQNAQKSERRISELDRHVSDVANVVAQSRLRIEKLNKASEDLALLLTRLTWLQNSTKNEFGTPRAVEAQKQIDIALNAIVGTVIPDPLQRQQWVQQLLTSLPKPMGQ